MYLFRHDAGFWNLWAIVAGSFTQLGSSSGDTLSATDTRSFSLEMDGSSITGLVGGSPLIGPITNTSITAKGKAGFRCNGTTSIAGKPLDNLVAEDIVVGGGGGIIHSLAGKGGLAGYGGLAGQGGGMAG
ncbi:MAG: hypothetical protein ABUJ92_00315 [Desulfobacterales bacterium]